MAYANGHQLLCNNCHFTSNITYHITQHFIEGLHDAVRMYTRTILPRSLVSFCTARYGGKTTKHTIILDSLHNKILNFTWVCVLIFLSLGCSLVLWYELNEKFWDILLCFPMPDCGARKPTWRWRVWWLAKFAWYDVTWKPSMTRGSQFPELKCLPHCAKCATTSFLICVLRGSDMHESVCDRQGCW